MTEAKLNFLAHDDDRALLFNNRVDTKLGSRIACEAIAKWSLAARIERDGKIKDRTDAFSITLSSS